MPDSSIPINAPTTVGQSMAAFVDTSGDEHEKVIVEYINAGGEPEKVSAANPLPVTDAAAEAALVSLAAEDFATQSTLAALLAKVITAPSTEAKQDAMIALLTTIAAITQPLTDVQLRATPVPVSGTVTVTGAGDASAANQTSQITQETAINTVLGLISDAIVAAGATGSISAKLRRATQGLEDLKTLIVLAAGANIIGKVGIDQTTPGTTNLIALTAETTKAIGVVRNSDGAGNLLTSNSTTFSAKFGLDANLLGTLGTAFSTAGKVDIKSTQKPSIGATVVLAVTALQSLASSATAGWKSVRTSNLATLATDYEIMVSLTTANTAPANDKAMYVFAIPWYTSDAGTTWFASSGGTTTLPSSADATYTIASPHNFRLLGVLNYTTAQMVVQDVFLLSNCFGNRLPDGFSICIINFSGAALSTGCIVDISPINDILV